MKINVAVLLTICAIALPGSVLADGVILANVLPLPANSYPWKFEGASGTINPSCQVQVAFSQQNITQPSDTILTYSGNTITMCPNSMLSASYISADGSIMLSLQLYLMGQGQANIQYSMRNISNNTGYSVKSLGGQSPTKGKVTINLK